MAPRYPPSDFSTAKRRWRTPDPDIHSGDALFDAGPQFSSTMNRREPVSSTVRKRFVSAVLRVAAHRAWRARTNSSLHIERTDFGKSSRAADFFPISLIAHTKSGNKALQGVLSLGAMIKRRGFQRLSTASWTWEKMNELVCKVVAFGGWMPVHSSSDRAR